MAKIFLSFLGTSNYRICTYYREGIGEVKNVRFVQEATIKLFCRDWEHNDQIFIFTTADAEKRNWLDDGYKPKDGCECVGLRSCLQRLSLSGAVKNVPIPEGKNEDEVWQIFQKVYEVIPWQSEVVFDITYALRSIPMLAIIVLNYAKVVKQLKLRGIYYGAFEVLGHPYEVDGRTLEERRVPILDLTSFDQLMDWTVGIDRFVETGNAGLVSELARRGVQPALKKTKGQDRGASAIREISNRLITFAETLTTCRGPQISHAASDLRSRVESADELDLLPPFVPLFEKIRTQLKPFKGGRVNDGLQAVRWCYQHNMIQQAYTILQETIIDYLVAKVGGDPQNISDRKLASQAVTIFAEKIPEDCWRDESAANREMTRKCLSFFQSKAELIEIMKNLSNCRNDLNHAGFATQQFMRAESFSKRLTEDLPRIESLVNMG